MAKFKVGDFVTYRPQSVHSRDAARGAYQVVRVMPSEKGATSYRIKSTAEGHERVAEEHELTRDYDAPRVLLELVAAIQERRVNIGSTRPAC